MKVCSKCGGAVSDATTQTDAQGNLLCRACSGAWRHPSVREEIPPPPAAPSAGASQRREAASGPWRLIGMVGGAAAAFLLVISIALVLGRSGLKKEISTLATRNAALDRDVSAARTETESVRGDLARSQARIAQMERNARSLMERQSKLQAELEELRKPSVAAGAPGAGSTASAGTRPGNGGVTGPVAAPVADRGPAPAGAASAGARPVPAPAEGRQLFAWKTSATLYHVAGCPLCAGREVIPITRAEALRRKLRPCSKCKPPTQ